MGNCYLKDVTFYNTKADNKNIALFTKIAKKINSRRKNCV